MHRFALGFFSSRVQRLGELGRPALCRFLARRNDRVWHERLLVPRRGGRAPRVVAGDRSRSAIPGCVVLGRPLAPTLCRPVGPSHCTRCQLPRCCIACAHTVRPDWHLQLQVRQLRPNSDCCTVATSISSVRGPWNASASCQWRAARQRSAAAASQQQAQRPGQTAYRAKRVTVR